jgi:hypothetical protein
MVKEPLTEQMIASGRKMVELLDNEKFGAVSAFWLFSVESNQWLFVVASPEVRKDGPKRAYGRIQRLLTEFPNGDQSISLDEVKVVPPDHPLVKLLRTTVRTGKGISGLRVTRNRINNTYIEDAYVYRAA